MQDSTNSSRSSTSQISNNSNLKKFLLILAILGLIALICVAVLGAYMFGKNKGKEEYTLESEDTVAEETTEEEETSPKRFIALISLDGFGSNLLNEVDAPYLYSLLEESSYTLEATTLIQSSTLPSHVSMLTGLNQEHHQVTFNSIDNQTPALESETLFDYVIDAGYSYYAFVTKEKLLYLLDEKEGENIQFIGEKSTTVVDDIDSLVETNSEQVFVFVHLLDLDSVGHQSGWGSVEQKVALKLLDQNLQTIIADFTNEFASYQRYFIITADHGGEGKQHGNGCTACRTIPIIIYSENVEEPYVLDTTTHNYQVYDLTCAVLDIMAFTPSEKLDCYHKVFSDSSAQP